MNLLIEKMEELTELFNLSIFGVNSTLKNDELTEEQIDHLVGALQHIQHEYSNLANEMKEAV